LEEAEVGGKKEGEGEKTVFHLGKNPAKEEAKA